MMGVWSGHISGDKEQGCEVNQAKGLAMANAVSASVSQKACFGLV